MIHPTTRSFNPWHPSVQHFCRRACCYFNVQSEKWGQVLGENDGRLSKKQVYGFCGACNGLEINQQLFQNDWSETETLHKSMVKNINIYIMQYNKTSSYSGKVVTRQTTVFLRACTTGKINTDQTKPGNTQKGPKWAQGSARREVCKCVDKAWFNLLLSSVCRHVDSTCTVLGHKYWPVHSHSNCPSAVVGFSLSSGNVRAEFTGSEVRVRQQQSNDNIQYTMKHVQGWQYYSSSIMGW